MKVVTSSGQTSDTRDVTWEVERMPIIAAAPNAGAATGPETWDAHLRVSYLQPVLPMPPVPSVPPVVPVLSVPSAQPVTPVQPVPPVTPVLATVPPEMTPVMSPSSPPGTDNPQVDEPPPDNELLQPGRTRARTRVYHQANHYGAVS